MSEPESLTEEQHALIRFEIANPGEPEAKDELIREVLHMNPRKYRRCLTWVVTLPSARAEYPVETRRISHRLDIAAVRGMASSHRRFG